MFRPIPLNHTQTNIQLKAKLFLYLRKETERGIARMWY